MLSYQFLLSVLHFTTFIEKDSGNHHSNVKLLMNKRVTIVIRFIYDFILREKWSGTGSCLFSTKDDNANPSQAHQNP